MGEYDLLAMMQRDRKYGWLVDAIAKVLPKAKPKELQWLPLGNPFVYQAKCRTEWLCTEAHWHQWFPNTKAWCPGPGYVEPPMRPGVAAIRAALELSIFYENHDCGEDTCAQIEQCCRHASRCDCAGENFEDDEG